MENIVVYLIKFSPSRVKITILVPPTILKKHKNIFAVEYNKSIFSITTSRMYACLLKHSLLFIPFLLNGYNLVPCPRCLPPPTLEALTTGPNISLETLSIAVQITFKLNTNLEFSIQYER